MRVLIGLLIGAGSVAGAQYPPKSLTNVKVFPPDISVDSLLETMAGFTRALGVRCTYCHAGRDGQPLDSIDFASDARPAKEKARDMLRMVAAINGEHLARLATRRSPTVTVECFTCHHGIAVPRTLQQVLLGAHAAGGVDSVMSAYRALRARYYGSAVYDFGEVTLVDVANAVRSSGSLAEALRLYQLNVEMVPTSTLPCARRPVGSSRPGTLLRRSSATSAHSPSIPTTASRGPRWRGSSRARRHGGEITRGKGLPNPTDVLGPIPTRTRSPG